MPIKNRRLTEKTDWAVCSNRGNALAKYHQETCASRSHGLRHRVAHGICVAIVRETSRPHRQVIAFEPVPKVRNVIALNVGVEQHQVFWNSVASATTSKWALQHERMTAVDVRP